MGYDPFSGDRPLQALYPTSRDLLQPPPELVAAGPIAGQYDDLAPESAAPSEDEYRNAPRVFGPGSRLPLVVGAVALILVILAAIVLRR